MDLPDFDSTQKLHRVLSLRDLVFYGIVAVTPSAPATVFGLSEIKSHGHVVVTILAAMVAMVLTAISYGRMAAVYPSAGSAYAYVSLTASFSLVRGVPVTVAVSMPSMAIDLPAAGIVGPTFRVAGWAVDRAAAAGTGVDGIHVWAFPASGCWSLAAKIREIHMKNSA